MFNGLPKPRHESIEEPYMAEGTVGVTVGGGDGIRVRIGGGTA